VAVFAMRWFRRWMRQQGLGDRDLCRAVVEMARGLIDADLGGALLKKRLARIGQGKRGGYRTFVARHGSGYWLFIYGFAKSDRANISAAEDLECRRAAKEFLSLTERQRARQLDDGILSKVNCDAQIS